MPAAPARFSTTTDWPHFAASLAATVRAEMSVPPPGGNGTMKVTGLAGYGCASAAQKNRARPHFPLLSAARRKMESVPVFLTIEALYPLWHPVWGRESGEAAPGVAGERLAEPLVLGSGLGLGFREAQLARAPRVRLSTQVGLHEHDAQLLAVEPTRQVEQAKAVARGAAQAFGLDARLHLQAASAIARERAADPALRILSQREHHGAPGSVRRSVGAGIVLRERRSAGEQSGGQAGGAQHRNLPMQFSPCYARHRAALAAYVTPHDRSTVPAPAPVRAPFSQVGSPLTSVISMPRERTTMRFAPPGRS